MKKTYPKSLEPKDPGPIEYWPKYFHSGMTREESIEDDEESEETFENDDDLEQGQFFYDDVLQQWDDSQVFPKTQHLKKVQYVSWL
uniref:Uncharacterized protein n=1 Tax=Caenorhabditis japonica TaxID=281687 RepID=A0A8R1ICR6_CAEJA